MRTPPSPGKGFGVCLRARERLLHGPVRREEARHARGVQDVEPHVLHRARVKPAERRKHEHPVQVPVPERLPFSLRGRLLLLRRIEGDLLRYHVAGRRESCRCHHLPEQVGDQLPPSLCNGFGLLPNLLSVVVHARWLMHVAR